MDMNEMDIRLKMIEEKIELLDILYDNLLAIADNSMDMILRVLEEKIDLSCKGKKIINKRSPKIGDHNAEQIKG